MNSIIPDWHSCLALQPILPNIQLPKQNESGSGTSLININSTHVTTTCLTLYGF